jgi:hypothetical protein
VPDHEYNGLSIDQTIADSVDSSVPGYNLSVLFHKDMLPVEEMENYMYLK